MRPGAPLRERLSGGALRLGTAKVLPMEAELVGIEALPTVGAADLRRCEHLGVVRLHDRIGCQHHICCLKLPHVGGALLPMIYHDVQAVLARELLDLGTPLEERNHGADDERAASHPLVRIEAVLPFCFGPRRLVLRAWPILHDGGDRLEECRHGGRSPPGESSRPDLPAGTGEAAA
eukprot:scaffold1170_cov256-Pinguiococcus_pyrenoidosus.AAC.3